jgi:hypothetical protein
MFQDDSLEPSARLTRRVDMSQPVAVTMPPRATRLQGNRAAIAARGPRILRDYRRDRLWLCAPKPRCAATSPVPEEFHAYSATHSEIFFAAGFTSRGWNPSLSSNEAGRSPLRAELIGRSEELWHDEFHRFEDCCYEALPI